MIVAGIALASRRANKNIADLIDLADMFRQNQGCCIHFRDDRRAGHLVAGLQLATVVNLGSLVAAGNEDGGVFDYRPGRVAGPLFQLFGPGPGFLALYQRTKIINFVLCIQAEGEKLFVQIVELSASGVQAAGLEFPLPPMTIRPSARKPTEKKL